MKIYLLFLCLVIKLADCRDICFQHDDLGCFTDSKPFGGTLQRPLAFLPEKPEKIGTTFTLFNRDSKFGRTISLENVELVNENLKTKFIIHGFIDNHNKKWVQEMRAALLLAEDVNVITVDWSKGAGLPYTQATANSQVVGREIAKLIDGMCKNGATAEDFHLIGHSLGAHISGYAGYRLKNFFKRNLGRISGLDPAGPYFENTDPKVRLDPTDAEFVDVIHTDGSATIKLGLGMFQSTGHVDFYPNGGFDQPDCPQTSDKLLNSLWSLVTLNPSDIEEGVACSHQSSFHLYTDSILKSCKYTSFPCNNQGDYDNGLCLKCSSRGCNSMGYWASSNNDYGKLYLDTQSVIEKPFCMQNYRVTLFSKDEILQTRGKFKAYFVTENHQSKTFILDDNETTFKKDSEFIKLISLEERLDEEIKNIYVSFDKTTSLVSGWLYWDQWSFHNIEIFNGETQVSTNYCPYTPIIQSGSTVRFNKC